MEPLFENRYIHTKEILREFYKKTYLRKQIIPLSALAAVSLFGIIMVGLIYKQPLTFSNWLVFAVLPLLLFAMVILLYFRILNINYARQLELNQGREPEALVRVMPNEIELHNVSNGGVNHIAFTQIKKIIETRNLYILMMKSKLAVILRKDSFTAGSFGEFKLFIRASLKSAKN